MEILAGILVFKLLVKKNVYFVVHDFAGKLNVARANEILQECLRWLRGSW